MALLVGRSYYRIRADDDNYSSVSGTESTRHMENYTSSHSIEAESITNSVTYISIRSMVDGDDGSARSRSSVSHIVPSNSDPTESRSIST